MKDTNLWGDQRRFVIEGQEDFVKLVDFGCAATVGLLLLLLLLLLVVVVVVVVVVVFLIL